eukprot:11164698-Lingulodinium_polyedra.AAC.1
MSIVIATANDRALLEPNPAMAVSTRMSGETEIVGSHCTWIIPLEKDNAHHIVSRCFLTSPLATIGNHDAKNSKRHHNFATRANADGCCMHANQVLTRHVDDLQKKTADMHQASNAPVYVCIIAATMCCTYTGNATRTLSMLQHPTRGASFLTRRQDRLFDACGGIVGVWEQPGIV